MSGSLCIRFYGELNDFLAEEKKKQTCAVSFKGHPAVKDLIEAQGVPHTEVDLILVNGNPVDFYYHVRDGDFISVYPVFEAFDISQVNKLRKEPLRNPAFVLDVHLGKLARCLRLLGFDALYRNDYDDPEIAEITELEKRIVLTRDIGLLKRGRIERGYWLRSQNSVKQLAEVVKRFDLKEKIRPFKVCMRCNSPIENVAKADIEAELQPGTRAHYDIFYRCRECGQIYWQGNHYPHLMEIIKKCTG